MGFARVIFQNMALGAARGALKFVGASEYKNINSTISECLYDRIGGLEIDEAQVFIKNNIMSGLPFMACRFGSVELDAMRISQVRKFNFKNKLVSFIQDKKISTWSKKMLLQLSQNAGFFPCNVEAVEKFCDEMKYSLKYIDLLGSWLPKETYFDLGRAKICRLSSLEPYLSPEPWSSALEGKKVCVIHPFAKTIEKQYKNRSNVFSNKSILPDFNLSTVVAVQSIRGNHTKYADWFEALSDMEHEALEKNFDIAIIGCGAYGLPLAARIKRAGRQAIHLGGATQILFGIRGKRWDDNVNISKLYNDSWVRPAEEERPLGLERVEGGCYW